jgi:hypothetical protein
VRAEPIVLDLCSIDSPASVKTCRGYPDRGSIVETGAPERDDALVHQAHFWKEVGCPEPFYRLRNRSTKNRQIGLSRFCRSELPDARVSSPICEDHIQAVGTEPNGPDRFLRGLVVS